MAVTGRTVLASTRAESAGTRPLLANRTAIGARDELGPSSL